MTHRISRPSTVRPTYRGQRGKHVQHTRIRASDLPAIADALGLTIDDMITTAKRITT